MSPNFSPFQTKLFLASVEEEGQAGEERMEMAETLLSALTDRQQQRQTWRDSGCVKLVVEEVKNQLFEGTSKWPMAADSCGLEDPHYLL
ncbi:unnamed protein product [Tetraodon nigroviridis]|uniref:(spotted green pufferfish) hypothetical protein n=1 Tax=Tetraodon nigroviridis TaxID=99883 RepID=Q4S1Q7_TETNG|nr:unnamed protein product [Tetraodon nigroviridis]